MPIGTTVSETRRIKVRVAFHSNQICLQGTEVALFDYAHFNEKLLGNKSLIISRDNKLSEKGGAGKNQPLALAKFKERFDVVLYKNQSELEDILKKNNIDVFYALKKGVIDGVESKSVRTVVHTVFKYYEPHGAIYAYVSKWLSDLMTGGKAPFVPHMIYLPKSKGDLRQELGIPEGATVFGRYGGTNSFDIPFVHEEVVRFADEFERAHFIFMNTDDFLNPDEGLWAKLQKGFKKQHHSRIHFLRGSASLERKSQFINTCDAMLHARLRGETFGVAVGEFSVNNVPVITYGGNGDPEFEGNHLAILGSKSFVYHNNSELRAILKNIVESRAQLKLKNWDAYSAEYGPEAVMKKFAEVFLNS